MQRSKSCCLSIVTTSPTTLAHKNHECEAPRVVPCHAQNLTTQSSGRVTHDELFLADREKRECGAGTVLMIFGKHFCQALTSSPLPSSDIPAFDAYQHVSGSDIFDSSARSNKQSRSAWSALGRGRPHRRHSMSHRVRQVLAPFASSACAHLLLPSCAVWPPWSDCPSSAVVSVVVELHWEVLGCKTRIET